jgi:hypothetical protein
MLRCPASLGLSVHRMPSERSAAAPAYPADCAIRTLEAPFALEAIVPEEVFFAYARRPVGA